MDVVDTPDGRGGLTERQSYLIVGAAHVVLLGALSLALRSVTPPPLPPEGVPIEVVTDAPTRPAPPVPTPSKPRPAEPTPPPTPVPPTPAPPAPTPPPKPTVPTREPPKQIDETAPPAKAKPKPLKAEPKPPKIDPAPLDTAALTKLLDKAAPKPKAKPLDTKTLAKALDDAVPKAKPLDTAALTKSLDAALPKAAALPKRGDPKIAAAIAAAIRAQVTPCWTLPVGGGASGKVTALLRIAINRDGSIAGRPGLVSQTGVTGTNSAYARAFAEAASRAVLRCAPFKLPADQYDQWAAVEINFDPSDL